MQHPALFFSTDQDERRLAEEEKKYLFFYMRYGIISIQLAQSAVDRRFIQIRKAAAW